MLKSTGRVETDNEGLRRRKQVRYVEHPPQAPALEVLRDEIRRVTARIGSVVPIVDHEDVGMVQLGDRAGFGSEAAQKSVVVGERLVQQLDRNPTPEGRVVGKVNLG